MLERSPHTLRFALAAALVGLIWYAIVVESPAGVLPEPWSDFREGPDLILAIAFVLGVLVPAWCFRREFPPMRTSETFGAAVLALPMIVLCFMVALFAACYLSQGLTGEEFEEAPTLLAKLELVVAFFLLWSAAGIAAAFQVFYVFLPLCWLSILALRWASGRVAPPETWTLAAAHRRRAALTPRPR